MYLKNKNGVAGLFFAGAVATFPSHAVPIDIAITFATDTSTPEASVAEAISTFCGPLGALSSPTADQQRLLTVCTAILGAPISDTADAYYALGPRAATAETTLSSRGPDTLFFAGFEKRLNALRKIASLQTSVAPVEYYFDGQRIPTQWLTAANDSGTTSDSITTDGLLSNRWGGFFDFGSSRADQDETSRQAGLKTTLNGISGGIDYRLRSNAFLGAAGRYQQDDGDIGGGLGSVEGSNITLSGFATYYPTSAFYLEGTLLYNTGSYDLKRQINFDIGGTPYSSTAKSSTDTQRTALTLDGGYTLNFGAHTVLLTTSLLYGRSTIDGFTEKNGQGFDLKVGKQTIDFATWTFGGQVTRAFSTTAAVIIPEVSLIYVHELKNDGQKVTSNFTADPTETKFSFTTDNRDDSYLRTSLGSTFVFTRGRSAFIRYEQVLAYEHLKLNSIALGARLEF